MSSLKTVQNLGILCSVLVFTGFICDIVHCIITYRVYKEKTKELTKRKRQLTLSIFVAGIICFTFPIIAYFIVAVFWKSLQFKMKNFGFCYLICTICIFIQICCLCYFKYLKKRLKYKEQVHELFQEVYQTLDSEDNRSSF
ncbi:hypothetical protein PPERSA_03619 [Pseudocohnilembus persalinus]|uniref:Uncharacterized protein n=1 Tax=Pseudocohnilembus persalinus TaxID=266149 RepID=A0A0V0QDY6_PSEPJ|nr:hypothetical protein PPERSA_03619 [Pseudocohnilembus persalinus]|eukprot:KRX00398.1 hypothetical protein PPERSA_03619 [Pseudocohnilembus persalinus]